MQVASRRAFPGWVWRISVHLSNLPRPLASRSESYTLRPVVGGNSRLAATLFLRARCQDNRGVHVFRSAAPQAGYTARLYPSSYPTCPVCHTHMGYCIREPNTSDPWHQDGIWSNADLSLSAGYNGLIRLHIFYTLPKLLSTPRW